MAFSDPIATGLSTNPYIDGLAIGSHWDDPGSAVTTRLAVHIAGVNGIAQTMTFGESTVSSLVNAQEVAAFNTALALLASVCRVTFSTAGSIGNADIVLGVTNEAGVGGAATLGVTLPPDVNVAPLATQQSPVLVNRDAYSSANFSSLLQGGFDFVTFIHEIGHALGLKHPFDAEATTQPFPGVTAGQQTGDLGDNNLNQGIFTMMSYNDGYQTGPLGPLNQATTPHYGWTGGPMAFDIAALQHIYGANTTTRTGNDAYTLPTVNAAGTYYSSIWDAGGTDIMRHTGAAASTIDLREATLLNAPGGGGFVSTVTGIHGGFTIARNAVIENASGGSGIDTITGNAVRNDLRGNGGNDIINAGAGDDLLVGGDGDDTINADANNDIAYGQTGRDTMNGGDGDDTLYGGDEVGAGDILLAGGLGIDWVSGGLGNDTIDGGDGNDRYLGGDGGNDTINGGLGNDRLEGGLDSDALQGQDGNDYILGGDGIDTENGGTGIDYLYGDAGNDVLDGGGDNDNIRSGIGADTINFELANGSDVVFDFVNDQDTLRIDPGYGLASAAAVLALTIQTGNHVRILLPGAATDIYLWDYLVAGSGNSIGNLADDIIIG